MRDPLYGQYTPLYSASQILTEYGSPSEIMIAPFPQAWDSLYEWRPFFMVLIYEDQNFMVIYSTLKNRLSHAYQGCFSDAPIMLTSWSPQIVSTWQEALQRFQTAEVNPVTIKYFKPLSEASELSIDAFYQRFRDSSQDICISTPTALWPNISPAK